MNERLLTGTPEPQGANWDGNGVNFAVFSENAQRVQLCLFDRLGREEIERFDLTTSDHVWHGYLPECKPGTVYGYRVHGPYDPSSGHRFNPNKLLLDPYAKELCGTLRWDDSLYGFDRSRKRDEPSHSDSAACVPKAVVVDETFDWGCDRPPRVPWACTVIYETHVRGFTRLHPSLNENIRGSYAALASDSVIRYLKSLGVTSVELLPVHAFIDDHFLVNRGLVNFWGYNTLNFFALEARYLSADNRNEFKTMVKRLHEAGIEVILDVVYNHTAEGDETGPTLCFRGIDNSTYYRLPRENPQGYINDSGCGNSLNLGHPQVLKMVIDSLKYWVEVMHVDGFRFDLAASLGRATDGFDPDSQFFQAIRKDPILSKVKLIAEPWDVGPGGYQLGAFPRGWAEWNDRFRDTVRRYWHGEEGLLPHLARGLHGSSDLFEHNGRRPSSSINFITSHDGFTLRDLVSFNKKHNQANGEKNRDGHTANYSYNYGAEGESSDPEIIRLRQRQCRNLLATLFFAHGTPMLLAGDELGRSQQGNNNAYCQDNPITWLDWTESADKTEMFEFTRELIRIRKEIPLLHRNRFVHGEEQFEPTGFTDIQWLGIDGLPMKDADWETGHHRFLAMLLAGDAMPARSQFADEQKDAALVIVFNASTSTIDLVLPQSPFRWECLLTTADASPEVSANNAVAIEPRSVQLFELQR